MIDIHSHILPGVDDGAQDMETSVEMIKNAVACDTGIIVATPHYFRNRFELSADDVADETEKLKAEIKKISLDIEIYSGQEILIDNYTVELFKKGIIRGLCGTDYILVEFPMDMYAQKYLDIIYELRILGARPIIAHPERYVYIIESMSLINKFADEGCLFQVNSSSITGVFGRKVHKTAARLIAEGQCHFIASDAHSTNRRCTGLKTALEHVKKIDHAAAVDMQLNSQLLLKNEKIINLGCKINDKKSFFSFFKSTK